MHNSVEVLTRKIYQEGIERAKEDAEKVIREAHTKAQKIVEKAERTADQKIEKAKKRAAEIKHRNETEMRLAARQSMSNLQQKIRNIMLMEITSEPLANAFDDKTFVRELIEKLVSFWLENYGEIEGLNILLPKKDYEEAQIYVRQRAEELLKKGIHIQLNESMTNGFQISPEDGRFKVSFTAEDFENYFKTFAKPGLFKLLFGDNE